MAKWADIETQQIAQCIAAVAHMTEPKLKVIRSPIRLKDHVVSGRGPDLDTVLARVKKGLAALTDDYLSETQDDLTELDAALGEARAAEGKSRQDAVERIFRISHDLRGLGGTFDYPLVTHIGSSLCDLITRLERIETLHLEAIELHIGAIKLVTASRISGDGGKKGQELTASIAAMVDKVLADG